MSLDLVSSYDRFNAHIKIPVYYGCGYIENGAIVTEPVYELSTIRTLHDEWHAPSTIDALFLRIHRYFRSLNETTLRETPLTQENLTSAFYYIKRRDFIHRVKEKGSEVRADLITEALLLFGFPEDSLVKVAMNLKSSSEQEPFYIAAAIEFGDQFLVFDPMIDGYKPISSDEWARKVQKLGPFDNREANMVFLLQGKPGIELKKIRGSLHTLYVFDANHKFLPPESCAGNPAVAPLSGDNYWDMAKEAHFYLFSYKPLQRFKKLIHRVIIENRFAKKRPPLAQGNADVLPLERFRKAVEKVQQALPAFRALHKLRIAAHTPQIQTMSDNDFRRWLKVMRKVVRLATANSFTKKTAACLRDVLHAKRTEYWQAALIPCHETVGLIDGGKIIKMPTFGYYNMDELAREFDVPPEEETLSKGPSNLFIERVFGGLENYYRSIFTEKTCLTKATKENILAAFSYIKNLAIIPWHHSKGGCAERAEFTKNILYSLGFSHVEKVAINVNGVISQTKRWRYHTAAAVPFKDSHIVFDPTINPTKPLLIDEWVTTTIDGCSFDSKPTNVIKIAEDGTTKYIKRISSAQHTLYIFPSNYYYEPKHLERAPEKIKPVTPALLYQDARTIRLLLDNN